MSRRALPAHVAVPRLPAPASQSGRPARRPLRLWPELPAETKLRIAQAIAALMRRMRAIPATPPTEADRAHYLKRLYVASESGIVAMFDTSSEKVVKLGEGFAGNNAHSIAVAPSTGLVYLPIRNLNGHPALRIMEPIPER